MLSAPGNVEQIAADDHRAFEEILAENQAENGRVATERQKQYNLFSYLFVIGKILAEKTVKQ